MRSASIALASGRFEGDRSFAHERLAAAFLAKVGPFAISALLLLTPENAIAQIGIYRTDLYIPNWAGTPLNGAYGTYALTLQEGTTVLQGDVLKIKYDAPVVNPQYDVSYWGQSYTTPYRINNFPQPQPIAGSIGATQGVAGDYGAGLGPALFFDGTPFITWDQERRPIFSYTKNTVLGTNVTSPATMDYGYFITQFSGVPNSGFPGTYYSDVTVTLERAGAVLYTASSADAGYRSPTLLATPLPGPVVPPPEMVPGKEYSDRVDINQSGAPTPEQTLLFDGSGGVKNGNRYGTTGEVDGMAYAQDSLFKEVISNQASLVFSTTGDDPAPILYVSPNGDRGIWAREPQINRAGVSDLDGLELWGPEGIPNANRYSLMGDPDGIAVFNEASFRSPAFTVAELASSIGLNSSLWSQFDLDGLMTYDDQILFSIAPLGSFDGGEIWSYKQGDRAARFLQIGDIEFDTELDVRTTFGTSSENIDALEAVATRFIDPVAVPEPSTGVFVAGWAVVLFGIHRRKTIATAALRMIRQYLRR